MMFTNYTHGPWKWERHILNADYQTKDGSKMDHSSIILMVSRDLKKEMRSIDAILIEKAPELYEAMEGMLSYIESSTWNQECIDNVRSMLIESIGNIQEQICKDNNIP